MSAKHLCEGSIPSLASRHTAIINPMSRKEVVKKAIILFLLITSISAGLIYIQNQIGLEKIREIIIRAGFWGPFVYILLILLTQIVAPLQSTPFYFLGFVVFGKWTIIYAYIAYLISGFTNFWIARMLGRDIVIKLVGKEGMAKVDHIAKHEGVKALIIMRFFQGFINDFVSYAAGFTSMKFKTYYIVSLLVPIPWVIGMILLFNKISQELVFYWSLVIGVVAFIIPPLYYYLKHNIYKSHVTHK